MKIRKHKNKIAVDRKLLNNTLETYDAIHALDALILTIRSDPTLQVPDIFKPLQTYLLNPVTAAHPLPPREAVHSRMASEGDRHG
jgi:hypothetical protein